ncbi:rhamnogalacturonan lyase [Streptomyces sp. DSM 44915]|uniref:Rhamnogalacturonan lyase n=1 Tax=Streptomyces chisholmiae TaxID=3075540 RepID=A0ABU2JNZ0_9ACTN|nr:rhamnogalacturonan lyase [Streptomyces sp. DSM 44915]MDT0266443.1 rhamnogalacturonan lyase [Streptomyces sp. DSM 44915]
MGSRAAAPRPARRRALMARAAVLSAFAVLATAVAPAGAQPAQAAADRQPGPPVRQMERLDRAPVAVPTEDGVLVGWRMLGLDPKGVAFHVYRDGERITDRPLREATSLVDPDGTADSVYQVVTLGQGNRDRTEEFGVWADGYRDIPVNRPAGGVTPTGEEYTYHLNDASIGDLDGDGRYEIVQKWDPSNAQDNSRSGYTGNVYLDAYTLDGEQLWRVDLGPNIRAGAHYTQFQVYDLDGDGRSEVVLKTADGTVDGAGEVIGDPTADHRNASGYVLEGPEFLTVLDGETGAAVDTVDYEPPRGDICDWGDCYGNRGDRYLAGVAYLDGRTPSVLFARGYYTRSTVAAYDFDGERLTRRWFFDSNEAGAEYEGQGNHNLAVGDVDGDGRDELVYGSMTIDDDGTPLYNTGLGHGDAAHLGDLDPDRPGLELFSVHESMSASGNLGGTLRDAGTGEVIYGMPATRDIGRGAAGDIDPRHRGAEAWAVTVDGTWNSREGELRAVDGELIGTSIPSANFMIWWDGDPLREILDHTFDEAVDEAGAPFIAKWDWEAGEQRVVFEPEGTYSNNWTKGTPVLQADLYGDWREEVVLRTQDESALRVFTTSEPTELRLRTLMHDPQYRLAVAWQNTAYNQPPHPGFYLGDGMTEPPAPRISYPRR